MSTNGILDFQGTNKATFVGENSNVVIDTVNASFGIGVDVNGPTSNLHVVGNAYVSSNLEVGTANLFVDTVNSRVGIGTTSPKKELHVYGDGTETDILIGEDTAIDKTSLIRYKQGDGSATGVLQFGHWGDSFGTNPKTLCIKSGGNVGIGTTDPNEKLEIYGDGIRIHDPDSSPKLDFIRGGTSRNPNTQTFGLSDYSDWRITANGPRLNFQNQYAGGNSGNLLNVMTLEHDTGNVGIGEDNPTCKLTVGDDSVSVNSGGGVLGVRQKGNTSSDGITLTSSHPNSTRMYKDGSGHFNIYNTGGGTFTLENVTGNVGIGKTDPDAKLHVNGNAIIGDVGGYSTAVTHQNAQLTLGGSHNAGYNNNNQIKLLISGGNNDGGSPYYIMCEDENGYDQFYLKGATSEDGNGTMYLKGSVGIGTSDPKTAIHVIRPDSEEAIVRAGGTAQGTGRFLCSQSSGATSFNGGGIEYNGDNSPGYSGAGADYVTLFRHNGSAAYWTAKNVYNGNQWEFRQTINDSDDRVKENEKYICGATETLMKIKPQLYDKKPSIESTDTKEWVCESGLIAQELYYDVPELKHLVKIPRDARDIDTNVSITSDDPTVDPDYSAWGKDTSAVNYIGLVPYLIKSVQEITTELPRHKTPVSNITPRNIENFVGMIVSKKGSVELSTKSEDKACYGVISEITCDTQNNEILVNSSGEGKIWVTNVNGNLEAGDLITTSNIVGYGELQNSSVLSNFTVAKLTEDCDFSPPSTPVRRIRQEMSNVTVYSVSREVRVTEEEYNELAEEDRTTENRITYFDGDQQIDFDTYSNSESNTLRTETTLVFKLIHRHTSRTMREQYIPEVRQELVNVLDEHGQLQWEDHPTETEKAYKIRYLDADGNITDEANAVHKAAFVGCTYHCG